jgi:UDPglucose 6-dehydrogenase
MTGYRIVIAKSTVPVGTHKKITEVIKSKTNQPFDYVSNPEFLKEGSAIDDFMKPERVIIGTNDSKVMEIMKQLYAPFMRRKERIIFMDPMSAELTKYAANCMLATRISFMNELSGLCEIVGADIEAIRKGIGSDSRIGSDFLFPGIGFGGSCFPKDIRAMIQTGQSNNCSMSIIEAVMDTNLRQQKRFAEKIISYYSSQELTTLAVWGLAFKARTDDIRESPAINCIKTLLNEGIKIKAFDPEAMANAKEQLSDNIVFCDDQYEVLENADGLAVMTDWQQFRNPDFELIHQKLKKPVLFDGRNLYDPKYVISKGLEYHGIGRANGLIK